MMKPEDLKWQGGISLDPNVHKGIKELAKQDDRTFSAFANIILRNFLERHSKKKLLKRRR